MPVNFQSKTRQFNELMEMVARMLMNKELVGERMKGYQGLETQRQAGRMEGFEQKFIDAVALSDPMKQHTALISKARQMGNMEEAARLEQEAQDVIDQLLPGIVKNSLGMEPTSKEIRPLLRYLSEGIMDKMTERFAGAAKQREMIKEVHIPGQKLEEEGLGLRREELGVRRGELGVRKGELEQKKIQAEVDLDDTQRKEQLKRAQDIEKYLIGEGVKGEGISFSSIISFGDPKLRDPLSPEKRGMALTYVGQIINKLQARKPLTQGDLSFMASALNTTEMEKWLTKARAIERIKIELLEEVKAKGGDPNAIDPTRLQEEAEKIYIARERDTVDHGD